MDIGACQAPPKTAAELEWSCISNLSSPLSFPRISDICHGRVLGPLPPRTVGVKARDGHDAQAKKPPPGRSFRGIDHVRRSTSPRRLYRDLITRDPPDRSLKLSTADRRTQRSGKQFSSMASRRACMDMDVRRKKAEKRPRQAERSGTRMLAEIVTSVVDLELDTHTVLRLNR
ncbi:hypothetical protein BHE74_00019469 [Ensete ventricosum]|nr:hypothetical protein BHE74_00019469 [Ensete ventricosum]